MLKTTSAGMMLGPWSPSSLKTILLLSLIPGAQWMVRTLALLLLVCPPSFMTFLVMVIFFMQPWYISVRVRWSSLTMSGCLVLSERPWREEPKLIGAPSAEALLSVQSISLKSAKGLSVPKKVFKSFLSVAVESVAVRPSSVRAGIGHARFEAFFAKLVVHGSFCAVGKDIVGFGDAVELVAGQGWGDVVGGPVLVF